LEPLLIKKYRNRAGLNDWIYEKAQKEGSA
jgi:hypothetical protein